MKNITFSILLILFSITLGSAQSWRYSQFPSFRDVNAFHFISNDSILAIGGNEFNDSIATISITSDLAESWRFIHDRPSPMLLDICFPSDNIGYIVGWDGGLRKSIDKGLGWNILGLPGNLSSRDFNACWFHNDLEGIIVGGNESNDAIQTIATTSDGGQNWSIKSDNLGPWLRDITFNSDNTGLAVGDDNSILRTIDGGNSWTKIDAPIGLNNRSLYSATFRTNNNCFIVGGNPSNDSIQTILVSDDAGENWSILSDGLGSMFRDIAFTSDDHGLIVGDHFSVSESVDGGQSWQSLNLLDSLGNEALNFRTIKTDNSGLTIMGGDFGAVVVYDDRIILNPPNAKTIRADRKNNMSATVYGSVDPNGLPSNVFLDYGTSLLFENSIEIDASPLNGSVRQTVKHALNDLTPGQEYFFRYRAENQDGVSLGDTITTSTNLAEIPNWDFEVWDTVNFTSPKHWGFIGQIDAVPSIDMSHALKLQGKDEDDRFGLIFKGSLGPMGPDKGIAFKGRPATLSGQFNYDIVDGDNALIWLIFRDINGNTVVDSMYSLTGNSGGNFENIDFGINYKSQNEVDTLLLFILSGNPFGNANKDSYLILDNLIFSGTSDQLVNGDFEDLGLESTLAAQFWQYRNRGTLEPVSITRSTTSQSQDFALLIDNSSGPEAQVTLGQNPESRGYPVNKKYNSFHGYYWAELEAGDTCAVSLNLFRQGNFVSGNFQKFDSSTDSYQPFTLDLEYQFPSEIPDSMTIEFFIFNDGSVNTDSKVLIDNLSFDGPLLYNESVENVYGVQISPNPTIDFITIDLSSSYFDNGIIDISLRNNLGQDIIKTKTNRGDAPKNLNLSGLEKGVYFIQLKQNKKQLLKKLILQ